MFKSSLRHLLFCAGASLLWPLYAGVSYAGSNVASLGVTAEILNPMTINVVNNISFGAIIADTDVESVLTLPPSGTPSIRGGKAKMVNSANSASVGRIAIQGAQGGRVDFTGLRDVTLTAGKGTMTLRNIRIGCPDNQIVDISQTYAHMPSGDSTMTCTVGGELVIAPKQAADSYTGTLTLTVNHM